MRPKKAANEQNLWQLAKIYLVRTATDNKMSHASEKKVYGAIKSVATCSSVGSKIGALITYLEPFCFSTKNSGGKRRRKKGQEKEDCRGRDSVWND